MLVKLGDESLPKLIVVANAVFGGDKMFLVKSCEYVFMVDKYLSIGFEDDLGYNEDVKFYEEFNFTWAKGHMQEVGWGHWFGNWKIGYC